VTAPVLFTPERAATTRRLPFTVIDQAVHLLDTPAEPWGIQLEVEVAGHLDEDRLRTAVCSATAAHPMARARKVASRPALHTDEWEIAPRADHDPLRVVDCGDDDALAGQVQGHRLPPRVTPPSTTSV